MEDERQGPGSGSATEELEYRLPPAARRALAEAEARRRLAAQDPPPPKEIDGRGGLDPVRYGDWEREGRASDF